MADKVGESRLKMIAARSVQGLEGSAAVPAGGAAVACIGRAQTQRATHHSSHCDSCFSTAELIGSRLPRRLEAV